MVNTIIFFFQAEDGIRDGHVTGVQTCALPIYAFCNYSKLVTRVKVSDQTKPAISHKLPDISMNCYTYQTLYKEEVDKGNTRSEERRVGKECRTGCSREHNRKKEEMTENKGIVV